MDSFMDKMNEIMDFVFYFCLASLLASIIALDHRPKQGGRRRR
jgi:hypothetical protein